MGGSSSGAYRFDYHHHLFSLLHLFTKQMMSSTATLARTSRPNPSLAPTDPQAMATSSQTPQSEPQHLASSSRSDTPVTSNANENTSQKPHFVANMFGALNRFIAKLDAAPEEQNSSTQGFGFQVLRNTNAELPLEPWFDYIIGINGRTIVSFLDWKKRALRMWADRLVRTIRIRIYSLRRYAIALARLSV